MYLNLRYEFLKEILEYEGRTGTTAAMRDMAAAAIAQCGWAQLLLTAMASIKEEEGALVIVEEAWRKDLVRFALDELYKDQPPAERLRLSYQEWNDAATIGALISRIGALSQTKSRMGRLLSSAITEAEAIVGLMEGGA